MGWGEGNINLTVQWMIKCTVTVVQGVEWVGGGKHQLYYIVAVTVVYSWGSVDTRQWGRQWGCIKE